MKPKHFSTLMLAVVALLAASCSTPKMAQNSAIEDDVYTTTAKAKVYKPAEVVGSYYPEDSVATRDYYGKSNPDYDMDYSSRIDRFYYGSPSRNYYDPYYNYYGYDGYGNNYGNYYGYGNFNNNWLWSSMSLGWGGYFGSLYYNPYWGPYSAYNYWGTGYYGGGLGWGGGYWGGGGVYVGRNENYRPRPTRSGEGAPRPGTNYGNGIPSRGGVDRGTVGRPSRAENYNPAVGRQRDSGQSSPSNRPSRQPESRPTYSPPTRSEAPASRPSYTPPPSNSGGGSSNGGSSSGGGARPTRGGRG